MTILQSLLLVALLGMLLSPSDQHALVSTPAAPALGAAVSPRLRMDSSGALYLMWKHTPDMCMWSGGMPGTGGGIST
jgi:hypothetical protein